MYILVAILPLSSRYEIFNNMDQIIMFSHFLRRLHRPAGLGLPWMHKEAICSALSCLGKAQKPSKTLIYAQQVEAGVCKDVGLPGCIFSDLLEDWEQSAISLRYESGFKPAFSYVCYPTQLISKLEESSLQR